MINEGRIAQCLGAALLHGLSYRGTEIIGSKYFFLSCPSMTELGGGRKGIIMIAFLESYPFIHDIFQLTQVSAALLDIQW